MLAMHLIFWFLLPYMDFHSPTNKPFKFRGEASIFFPTMFCLNKRPRCYINSPTVWRPRQYSKHNGVGWGCICSNSRLDCILSFPCGYRYRIFPLWWKKGPNSVSYCKRAFPHQVRAHAEIPEHICVLLRSVTICLTRVQCWLKCKFYAKSKTEEFISVFCVWIK